MIRWIRNRLASGMVTDEIRRLRGSFEQVAKELEKKLQELQAQRGQVQEILQRMTEGVLVVASSGEVTLINPAAREILGSMSELVRLPELQGLASQVLQTNRPQVKEITFYAPEEKILRVHATTCQTSSGPGALLVLHDVTDLKRLEQVRRDFVANVSHELKTPLTAIQGSVETLLDGGALNDPEHGRAFVASIAEETGRLKRLVEDLLALAQVESKAEQPRREKILLGGFLKEQTRRYQPLAQQHQVSLDLDQIDPSLIVSADAQQLAQAVSNLLENAIKYNRSEGKVFVRAAAQDGSVQLEVEDTGIGIPPEDLPRVFERFYRVDKARSRETGGTGLGLSIVKHIVEAHGGFVEVQSQPGKGSCFTLSFPGGR